MFVCGICVFWAHMHSRDDTAIHTYLYVYTYVYLYTSVYMYTCIHMYTCMCVYTHIHVT
jgi:hypothetical protein